jgi:hypothetical protein
MAKVIILAGGSGKWVAYRGPSMSEKVPGNRLGSGYVRGLSGAVLRAAAAKQLARQLQGLEKDGGYHLGGGQAGEVEVEI